MALFVHTECIYLRNKKKKKKKKKKTPHAGPVEDKTALRVFFFIFIIIAKILLKDAHADLEF